MGMKLIITITYGLIEKQREEVRRLRTVWATWWPDPGQDPGLGRSWGTEQQHTVTLLVNRSTNDHNMCSKRQSSIVKTNCFSDPIWSCEERQHAAGNNRQDATQCYFSFSAWSHLLARSRSWRFACFALALLGLMTAVLLCIHDTYMRLGPLPAVA